MIDFGNYGALFSSLFICISSTVCFILKLKATINLNRGVSDFYFIHWQKSIIPQKWTVKLITLAARFSFPFFPLFSTQYQLHHLHQVLWFTISYYRTIKIALSLSVTQLACTFILFRLRGTPPYVNSNIYSNLSVYLIENDRFYLFNANAIKLSMAFFFLSSSTSNFFFLFFFIIIICIFIPSEMWNEWIFSCVIWSVNNTNLFHLRSFLFHLFT